MYTPPVLYTAYFTQCLLYTLPPCTLTSVLPASHRTRPQDFLRRTFTQDFYAGLLRRTFTQDLTSLRRVAEGGRNDRNLGTLLVMVLVHFNVEFSVLDVKIESSVPHKDRFLSSRTLVIFLLRPLFQSELRKIYVQI